MHDAANASGCSARWDLFCTVVDNYGDAGVAWRLARELAHEHGIDVTLWIDEPRALARIAGVDPALASQRICGIDVRARRTWTPQAGIAEVVVEVLECGLPEGYVDLMSRTTPAPRWFVLEYLSAEPWVDDRHGLPSPHPATGLARRFWFPGFSARTGGLLREHDLVARRDGFLRDAAAQDALWRTLGITSLPSGLRVSLFCYADAPMLPLLDAWRDGAERVTCIVPQGVATERLHEWAQGAVPAIGAALVRGALTLQVVPFVPQERYDELLWACDFNFVRGEDSFVRGQWAARPFVWHVYPQDQGAHVAKLDAFLGRYASALPRDAAAAYRALAHGWNARGTASCIASAWSALMAHGDALRTHALSWAAHLQTLPELATSLVRASRFEV